MQIRRVEHNLDNPAAQSSRFRHIAINPVYRLSEALLKPNLGEIGNGRYAISGLMPLALDGGRTSQSGGSLSV